MFAAIRPLVSAADLAVCHLETPLSPSGRRLSGYPRFNAPSQLAAAIHSAGYDACSVASNHAMDQGAQGVAGTLAVLDRAGLRHAGTARRPREARPRILTVRHVRVAVLSYTYGLNGFRLPRGRPWLVNLLSPGRILADARAARRAGSQFTVVFLHWGQEYRSTPTPTQRTLARRLLADPSVDLIVGHHAHVVQPVQRVNGKWVAFGMGNLLSAQSASCCPAATQDGVLLQVTIVHKAGRMVVGKVSYIPTWVEHPQLPHPSRGQGACQGLGQPGNTGPAPPLPAAHRYRHRAHSALGSPAMTTCVKAARSLPTPTAPTRLWSATIRAR
jgi:poly-gamma-glutamate synthesis protein (capsule biosynthesis protein)